MQDLATTVRVPIHQTMLVGGMTFSSNAGGVRNLYLFVTASVQELRDEEGAAPKEPGVE